MSEIQVESSVSASANGNSRLNEVTADRELECPKKMAMDIGDSNAVLRNNGESVDNTSPVNAEMSGQKEQDDSDDLKAQNSLKSDDLTPEKKEPTIVKSPVKRKQLADSSSDMDSDAETSPTKRAKAEKCNTKQEKSVRSEESGNAGGGDDSDAKSTPNKKKVTKDHVSSDSEDDDEEEELKPGLLEQPVVLEEGRKREKKEVQRYETPDTKEKKKVEDVADGRGTKFGDIPRIEYQLQRTTAEALKPLHQFLVRGQVKMTLIKRNLRQFSGFSFDSSSEEYQKKLDKLNKYTTGILKSMCEVMDLERSGTKDAIIKRMMDFLLKPTDSGKKLPQKKRRRSSGAKKSPKEKKRKSGSGKKPAKKKEKSKSEVLEENSSSSEDSNVKEEKSDSSSEEEKTPPKKKKRVEAAKSKTKKSESSSDEEKTPAKKKKKGKTANSKTKKLEKTRKSTSPAKTKKKKVPTATLR